MAVGRGTERRRDLGIAAGVVSRDLLKVAHGGDFTGLLLCTAGSCMTGQHRSNSSPALFFLQTTGSSTGNSRLDISNGNTTVLGRQVAMEESRSLQTKRGGRLLPLAQPSDSEAGGWSTLVWRDPRV
jgi:hypothetical protein